MKKLLIFLCLFNVTNIATAQIKTTEKDLKIVKKRTKSFGFRAIAEYNELTNRGFDALNNALEKSQINTHSLIKNAQK